MAKLFDHVRAAGYLLSQRLVGADRARSVALDELGAREGDRILDIGCGPAYYLPGLPKCDYVGFDTNSSQIAVARARYGERARFFDEPYTAEHQRALGLFDKVLLLGVLHHLDDATASDLLDLVARSLRPEGRVVAIDTPLYAGQSALSRTLAKNDRGDFVRYPDAYLRLASPAFERVESRLFGDTLSIRFPLFMMVMGGPRPARARSAPET